MEQKDYKSYEYKQVTVKENQTSFFIDGYENFGWILDENRPVQSEHGQSQIWLKRDRRIMNKTELTRLERNFEACVCEVESMEKSKTQIPAIRAISCGVAGTAFMAGSVFAVTAQPPMIWLCILLAVPGFLGWILPYFMYRKSMTRQTEKVAPFIDAKYDEMDDICKKGYSLL